MSAPCLIADAEGAFHNLKCGRGIAAGDRSLMLELSVVFATVKSRQRYFSTKLL